MIGTRWKVTENWRRLLAEFVVITVGVGLALAVQNWNEHRKERIAERQYLLSIAADLEESAEGLHRSRDTAIQNRAALERLIAVAGGEPVPPPADFARDLVFATYLGLPRLQMTTVEEMVSTGSLGILQDVEFKRTLGKVLEEFRHRSQWNDNYRRIEYTTEIALRGLVPIEIRTEGERALESPEVMAGFDAEAVAETLRANEAIVPILEDSIWTQARVMSISGDLLMRMDELQAMLAEMDLD